MCGTASEVVETIGRRHIDISCIQESRWKGYPARLTSAKGFKLSSYGAEKIQDFEV